MGNVFRVEVSQLEQKLSHKILRILTTPQLACTVPNSTVTFPTPLLPLLPASPRFAQPYAPQLTMLTRSALPPSDKLSLASLTSPRLVQFTEACTARRKDSGQAERDPGPEPGADAGADCCSSGQQGALPGRPGPGLRPRPRRCRCSALQPWQRAR